MIYNRVKKSDDININLITNYLINNNWIKVENFPNSNILQFKKVYDEEDFYINLPINEKFKDFKMRVKLAIETISELEYKDTNEIIDSIFEYDINLYDCIDTFSVRIKSDISEKGKIPLEYGKSAIEGIAKLFISAINNEENPRPYMLRINSKSKELSNYKLSQTAVGSYIFNIEIRNEINPQIPMNDIIDESISPQRKVIRRIQNGLYNISKGEEVDVENLYKEGLNANMCDAILNFKCDGTDLDIETSIKWAKGFRRPKDIVESVTITNRDFIKLRDISDKYKENDSVYTKISGYIIKLESDKNNKDEIRDGSVVIQTRVNKKDKKIKVKLSEEDYIIACDAHARDKIVSIHGELITQGIKMEIVNYNEFSVLDI